MIDGRERMREILAQRLALTSFTHARDIREGKEHWLLTEALKAMSEYANEMVKAEREACAKLCDSVEFKTLTSMDLADRIRSRTETSPGAPGKATWVDCPICGGTDMRREPDAETGLGYIFCTNLNCKSNGGGNASALEASIAVVPAQKDEGWIECDSCHGSGQCAPAMTLETRGPAEDAKRAHEVSLMRVSCWKCGGSGRLVTTPEKSEDDAMQTVKWAFRNDCSVILNDAQDRMEALFSHHLDRLSRSAQKDKING